MSSSTKTKKKTKYRILLVGSSGGGTATLGHTQSQVLIDAIQEHFKYGIYHGDGDGDGDGGDDDDDDDAGVHVELTDYFWINMDNGQGLDGSTGDELVSLIHNLPSQKNDDGAVNKDRGTLKEINQEIQERYDHDMACSIRDGQIDGIISVSSRPELFSETFHEASKLQIPVTGTGGKSLSFLASTKRVRIVGNAGGSVATTPETKAVSFCGSLARAFGLQYDPWRVKKNSKIRNNNTSTNNEGEGEVGESQNTRTTLPSWTSVLNGCLPAFWAVMLFKRFIVWTNFPVLLPTVLKKISLLSSFDHDEAIDECKPEEQQFGTDMQQLPLMVLESYALPIVCSVIMATSRRKTEGVIMASILAGCACRRSVVGGVLAGWIVAYGEEFVLYQCILTFNVPATMTNLLTSGFVGIFAFFIMTIISPSLAFATEMYRKYTTEFLWTPYDPTGNSDLEIVRIFFVSFLGSFFCYGSKTGWYHSVFLPLILIEMERGDASMLGTLDFLSLVLVSAGVCLGMWLTTESAAVEGGHHQSLTKRGFFINLLCGDFIEACYPYMEQHPAVSMSGYIASALSATVLTSDCKSSAYLPAPVSLWLADDIHRLLLASAFAMGIPFIATVTNQWLSQSINLLTLAYSG